MMNGEAPTGTARGASAALGRFVAEVHDAGAERLGAGEGEGNGMPAAGSRSSALA